MDNNMVVKLSAEQVGRALQEIVILHNPTEVGVQCSECYMPWPCRTVSIMKRHFEL